MTNVATLKGLRTWRPTGRSHGPYHIDWNSIFLIRIRIITAHHLLEIVLDNHEPVPRPDNIYVIHLALFGFWAVSRL